MPDSLASRAHANPLHSRCSSASLVQLYPSTYAMASLPAPPTRRSACSTSRDKTVMQPFTYYKHRAEGSSIASWRRTLAKRIPQPLEAPA